MKYLALALLLGCETSPPPQVVMPGNNGLPQCQQIWVGECPHLWCAQGYGHGTVAGLEAISKTCEPKNAIVTSIPPGMLSMPYGR